MQTPLRSPHSSQSHSSPVTAEAIRVTGIVQGVGFRPTVYRLAQGCGLGGEVCNDGEGVLIRVVGTIEAINTFVDRLQAECPPLAQIEAIYRTPLNEIPHYQEFKISHSVRTAIHTGIAPDAATCPQCRAETLDPLSRWYRYPFTNCTHCGPRLSIVKAIPYDRINTSMASFQMCPECAREYGTVTDRRFHAQPVACPQCGPKVWLVRGENRSIELEQILDRESDPMEATVSLLQQGAILAIKGMGGFHLACDATNETAVQQLRQRKHRYHKPFALMARDLEIIDRYCWINEKEKTLLQSPIAPIVLLTRKQQESASFSPIAPTVAPGMTTL
ncbi:MAG TPA: Sua5/YciO/YrdC/YwlC family protein, partial [Allocoleopsis sp.]